jgi:hypothetical protein
LSGVTKVVVDLGKFVLPSPLWGFDSGNQTKLQKEILCLCVSHIDLLSILIQDLFLFRVRPNPRFEY